MSSFRRRMMMASSAGVNFLDYLQFSNAGLLTDIAVPLTSTITMSFYSENWYSTGKAILSSGGNLFMERYIDGQVSGKDRGRINSLHNFNTTQRTVEYQQFNNLRSDMWWAVKVDMDAKAGSGTFFTNNPDEPISLTTPVATAFNTHYEYSNAFASSAVLRIFSNEGATKLSGELDRFYWLKIEENSIVKHLLLPYKMDNVLGVLDTITGKFYSVKIGNGTITEGI